MGVAQKIWNKIQWYRFRHALNGMKACSDVERLVEWGFSPLNQRFMAPYQMRSEMHALLTRVKNLQPRYVLEIGTCGGGLFFQFMRTCADDSTLISLDLPGGQFGGGLVQWNLDAIKNVRGAKQTLHFIRDDSHKLSSLENVRTILAGNALDVLFIDGDHAYAGVKQDFETYSPLVRKGGLIGFHDIVPNPAIPQMEVHRYWPELKAAGYACEEFVESWRQGGFGIGLITK